MPCLYIYPSLRKVSFHAAHTSRPSHLSHAFPLWPLIDLPKVEALEIDNNPAIWTSNPATPHLNNPNDDDDEQEPSSQTIHEPLTHLQTLHIKNYLPLPTPHHNLFSAHHSLHTHFIYGSTIRIPSHTSATNSGTPPAVKALDVKEVNLNTLLRLPALTRTLRHLSLSETSPTPQRARALFGSAGRFTGECLAGLGEMRALGVPAFALFGRVVGDERGLARFRREMGGEGERGRLEGVTEEVVVCLPMKLERLELVEDPPGVYSGGLVGLTGDLAACCAQGMYPALRRVVLWCRGLGGERCGWSREQQEEVEGGFSKVGVEFECRAYVPWPEEKVGGWRMVEDKAGDGR
jgi:hypothetical protein